MVFVESVILEIGLTLFLSMLLGAFFRKLGQPEIVGYLLGGVILGPGLLGLVTQNETIELFSELGIIMLLFFIGLELDARKFKQGGLAAFLISPVKMVLCFSAGFLTAGLFGLSGEEALMIGLILTFSSTAIVSKHLLDNKMSNSLEARISIPMLLIEDFVAVAALGLFAAYGSQGSFNTVVLNSLFFVTVSLLVVSWVPRKFVEFIENISSESHVALYVLGIALGFAWLASFFKLPLAIGAFLGGLLLSELKHSEQVKKELESFREFFAAFFFVSIGLKFQSLSIIAIIMGIVLLLVRLVAQTISFAFAGAIVGLRENESMRVSAVMASIGEFSLIIAGFAVVLSTPHASLILSSAIFLTITSTMLVAPLYNNSERITHLLSRIVPGKIKDKTSIVIDLNQAFFQNIFHSRALQNAFMKRLKAIGVNVFAVISVLYLALYANIEVKATVIPGIDNSFIIIGTAVLLALPIALSIAKQTRLMMMDVAVRTLKGTELEAMREEVTDLLFSLFSFTASVLLFVVSLSTSIIVTVLVALMAALGFVFLLKALVKLKQEKNLLIPRLRRKKMVRGGFLR